MELKALLLAITILAVVLQRVEADFYYNPVHTKSDSESRGLKCIPGRTILKMQEKAPDPTKGLSEASDEEMISRKSHMNAGVKEEYCKICVCSAEGKDEYCSGRPARNVNECLRLTQIIDKFKQNDPFEHTKDLPFRLRRDYIWHRDEIPYRAKDSCYRGVSYYTNNENANDTDIEPNSDIETSLDHPNRTICFYCVCAVSGQGVSCINRDTWFCDYYRYLRENTTQRDMYSRLLHQDRPTYFRQISWRMRRTMDEGIYDFVETVASNAKTDKCIPFVSQYTDCTEDNLCSGCNNCICVANGEWACNPIKRCPADESFNLVDERSMDEALYNIERDLQSQKLLEESTSKTPFVPAPLKKGNDVLLDFDITNRDIDLDTVVISMMGRRKRSVHKVGSNVTEEGIRFYHTVDDVNADTLKNDNSSGIIKAKKVEGTFSSLKATRRKGVSSDIATKNESLHIEFSEPKVFDSHIADNKIDTTSHSEDKYGKLEKEKLNAILGNHSLKQKDKELSKLIVNELKKGTEIIGDRKAPIMSNITFTPENDTLTAMAFIAGNLLNQLWNMEKDSSEESKGTEDLKHEKIADLLDLFKEPLNLRQESFLKNALEQLSDAIDKDKVLKNVSLCEKIEKSKSLLGEDNDQSTNLSEENNKPIKCKDTPVEKEENIPETKNEATSQALDKINNVLTLIKKFQQVHKTLTALKNPARSDKKNIRVSVPERKLRSKIKLTNDETVELNVFGKILEKLTKLLLPPKRSKNFVKNIKNHNIFAKNNDVANILKSVYNVDVSNSSLTAKDKIVLDYLNIVRRNPHCILNNLHDVSKQSSNVEGDILLNLSEFLKIKSFANLLALLEPEKIARSDDVTTKKPEVTTTQWTTISDVTSTRHSAELTKTKEKLKGHLKSIIEDLQELQMAKGFPASNLSIADTLPCIYNILNGDKVSQQKLSKLVSKSPGEKITAIFSSLKKDFKEVPTRRANAPTGPRPKSALVWERIVKNFDGRANRKANTRRTLNYKDPKTFEELKRDINELELSSKDYKNQVLLQGVVPAKRLVLLKTLLEEVKKYIAILDTISNSVENIKKISADNQNDLKDFVYNAYTYINLNSKVAKSTNKIMPSITNDDIEIFYPTPREKKLEQKPIQKQSMRIVDISSSKKDLKLTRDEIINQLIKNRIQTYIAVKESKELDLSNDVNYSIAKKILTYLEMGSYSLARELYKYIVSQKVKSENSFGKNTHTAATFNSNIGIKHSLPPYGFSKEPLLQFEDPTPQNQIHDLWLRQLMNLKRI